MKNLKGMVEFTLEQRNSHKGDVEDFADLVCRYALFLSLKLELWMFVPCDENGNVLKGKPLSPNTDAEWIRWENEEFEFYKAKERCLFEGFEIYKGNPYNDKLQRCISETTIEKWWTIEHIIHWNLELTASALKQIGL